MVVVEHSRTGVTGLTEEQPDGLPRPKSLSHDGTIPRLKLAVGELAQMVERSLSM